MSALKEQRKATPKHIEIKDLPPEQRIAQLSSGRKHFIDTIKLIAYGAETALVQIARETMSRADDASRLLHAAPRRSPLRFAAGQPIGWLSRSTRPSEA